MNLLLETLDWSSGCLFTAIVFVAVLCCAALMIFLCHLAWSIVDWMVEWKDRRWWAKRKRESYPYKQAKWSGAGPKLTIDQINAQCRENAAKRREWMTEFANQWPPYTHCSRCDWFGVGPCPNCNRVVPIIYKRQLPENETRKDL